MTTDISVVTVTLDAVWKEHVVLASDAIESMFSSGRKLLAMRNNAVAVV